MMNFIFRVKEALNSRAWEGIFRAIDQQLEVGKTLFHFFNQLACTMARPTTCNAQKKIWGISVAVLKDISKILIGERRKHKLHTAKG